jgi:serine/threonine-protein kinase HipA
MAAFILENQQRRREQDIDRLFRRVLGCILLGNNDAHAKNFALLYTPEGLRLAPFYDIVAASVYPRFRISGLTLKIVKGTNPHSLSDIGTKHLSLLAKSFELNDAALRLAAADLRRQLPAAEAAIQESPAGASQWKKKLVELLRKRWNGAFDSIGNDVVCPKAGPRWIFSILHSGVVSRADLIQPIQPLLPNVHT